MSEINTGLSEVGKEAAKESISQGFKLVDKILMKTSHRRAIDAYIDEIQMDTNLSKIEKAACIWNARRDIKRAANMMAVVNIAAEEGITEESIEHIDQDWFDFFMDKASNTSQEDIQYIWAKVLAQECEKPDSIPKALIHTLSVMGKGEAETFMRLGSFTVVIESISGKTQFNTLVFTNVEALRKYHISLDRLSALESIGLLQYGTPIGERLEEGDIIRYFGKEIKADDLQNKESIHIGDVLLSHTGEALMKIISPNEIKGFFEKVVVPIFHEREANWDDL